MHSIQDLMGFADPYAGFGPEMQKPDLQGWGSDHPYFEALLDAVQPSVVVEVGSWKGASAIHMAAIARRKGLAMEIVCVDTWLGSSEHVIDPGFRHSLRSMFGYPTLYHTFLSNVIAAGLQGIITPLPMASDGAAHVLRHYGVKAGLIYIDAAHEYDAALRDMTLYWELLTEDGILLCDDYGYSEVTQAACQFAATVRRPLYGSYGKAFIPKDETRKMIMNVESIGR